MRSLRSRLIPGSTFTVNRRQLETLCSNAASGLQTVLRIVERTAGDTGVPELKPGVGGLLLVIEIIKKTQQNTKDVEQLVGQIDELTAVLQKIAMKGTCSPAILERINALAKKWSTTADQVQEIAARNRATRFIRYNDDAQAIANHIQTINWSIQSFTVETLLAIEFAFDDHAHFLKDSALRIEEELGGGFQQVNARMDIKNGSLPYAIFAQYDYRTRDHCLEGTRKDVLDEIYHWIEADETTDGLRRIFWINGSAGTGKTTIASTVAKRCLSNRILGASFFCSRDDAECSNPKLIFTTIAVQLGQSCPAFAAEVARVLERKSDIGYSNILSQLEQLIINPLRIVRESFPQCLVVMDALDECKDKGTTSIILSSLSRHVGELAPLKFLITSRPEQRVTRVFNSSELNSETQRLDLHEVALSIVQSDIKQYLFVNLKRIGAFYGIEESWPSSQDIQELTMLSSGLFIFAATAGKYIEDENYSDPKHQLEKLLKNATKFTEGASSPHRHLDELYIQVLTHAFPDISPHLAGRLRFVVGSIVLLRDSLSPSALEQLLNLRTNVVRETLAHLHSVVIVSDHDTDVIRLLHPSFFDFLTNTDRCRNPNFLVNPEAQHTILARACLDAMSYLGRDICGIGDPSLLNGEVEDLPERIQNRIPAHIQYACRHWAFHLANGMVSDVILKLMQQFCSEHLLHWVEVCSLLGDLRGALVAIADARRAFSNIIKTPSDVMTLLYDCERFTREFFVIISISSLQIYHSALLFSPRRTLLRETYGFDQLVPLKIHNASFDVWDSCIRTMEGHSFEVLSVAFSPDGTRLASASYDKTIRLWDVVSGAHLNTLEGHLGNVNSMAFSPKNSYLASGSSDNTIRLWDVVSGTHLNTLRGHTGEVNSVAFSPDGTRLVSGSYDATVRLWDPATVMHQRTFQGHDKAVNAIAYSPDGMCIASGSDDKTIRIWDASTGALLKTLKGHFYSVKSLAFSQDATRLASGSYGTIRLWNMATGTQFKVLNGHSLRVSSIIFSRNARCIASGSFDSTVRLWDAVTGASLDTFTTTSSVNSVAFSPDSTRLASGSDDRNVRLWDIFSPDGTRLAPGSDDKIVRLWDFKNRIRPRTIFKHSRSVTCIAFTSDGTRIASGSMDSTIRIWDALNSGHVHTLKGHSFVVRSVAFSRDGGRVVSGSNDNTVRLWNAVSGAGLMTLKGHSGSVQSVAFSPGSKLVVSVSYDKTIRLWDARSGSQLKRIDGDSSSFMTVSFTPDGTRIVTGSNDRQICLWDLKAGTLLHSMEGDHGSVPLIANTLDPSQTSLPSPSSLPVPDYFMEGGWIVSAARKRIFWLPISCRPSDNYLVCTKPFTFRNKRVVVGTEDGRIIVFDLTDLEKK